MKLNLCCGPNIWPPKNPSLNYIDPADQWVHIDRVDQCEYLRILREDVSAEMAATWPEPQCNISNSA